jgi:hypothetical protein
MYVRHSNFFPTEIHESDKRTRLDPIQKSSKLDKIRWYLVVFNRIPIGLGTEFMDFGTRMIHMMRKRIVPFYL